MWRLFISLPLPEALLARAAREAERLERALGPFSRDLRFTRVESIHLTLKFLGETPEHLLPALSEALARAAASTAPFPIEFHEVGAFPSPAEPRVLYLGAAPDSAEPLRALARAVEQSFEPLGFATERRPFTPHLTLARVKERRHARAIGKRVAELRTDERTDFVAERIALMRSELRPEGARYSVLSECALEGAQR